MNNEYYNEEQKRPIDIIMDWWEHRTPLIDVARDWWGDRDAKEYTEEYLQEDINQLQEDDWKPTHQQGVNVIAGWVREFFADIGFLIIFLMFVLIASVYLGQKTLFYILSLILLSIIVVNAHKFRRMIELLKGVF